MDDPYPFLHFVPLDFSGQPPALGQSGDTMGCSLKQCPKIRGTAG
jgi:hypothetical protein